MQVYFFDYFQITEKLTLYQDPFSSCDGCIVVEEDFVFVFFSSHQYFPEKAMQSIEIKLNLKCTGYSYCLSDLLNFLAKS